DKDAVDVDDDIFIERKVKTRIMSGLPAMWSLGNFMGAAFLAFLLQFQLPWRGLAVASSAVIIACVVFF
ncbi:MFS transporter, partial [Megasphaera massiliensis]|nr:MFS transporter [Megasphaera massiliensis]